MRGTRRCWYDVALPRDSESHRILLTRHGETAWNALGKLQGLTDMPLNDIGRDQARALAARFAGAGIAAIWTSDLSRARETGEIVAIALGLASPTIDAELRERGFGVFEGLTRHDCETLYPDAWRDWVAQTGAPPGAEPREAASARLGRAMARIATSEGGPALVVSHGAVMRLWLMDVIGATIPVLSNAATFAVERDPGGAFRAERIE
jgi:probable phosphoglycerate mutase